MKFKEYVMDQKYLLLFYIVLMTYITGVVYLDPSTRIWSMNILYLNIVALVLFCIYFLGTYIIKKRSYRDMVKMVEDGKDDFIYAFTDTYSYEQRLMKKLFFKIYDEQSTRLEKIYADKKDHFEFISSWVHEIKTPISVSHLLIEKNRTRENRELFDSLEEEINRINHLVEQVLYYSKIDDFSRDYFINEVNLKKLVNETVKKHAQIFITKNIKVEIDDLDILVMIDKKWLLFILDQIILNALQYTPAGGLIKIYAETDQREKRLVIMDNGIGILPEDLERVFDRGFTGYNGREFSKSTGMGLYLARRLARKLGHDISVESVYNEFTRVSIHFPKLGDYLMKPEKDIHEYWM